MSETDDQLHRERMARKKAIQDQRLAAANQEKGLLIVHTGAGKGKTTAALGMVFRALGHGFRVGVVQFVKGAIATGEAALAARLAPQLVWHTVGEGFTWDTQSRERDQTSAQQGWDIAVQLLREPSIDLVLLDELNIALKYNYIPIEVVLEELTARRPMLHVIVTGRNAKPALLEQADLVTEMNLIKHPFRAGIKPQPGIEF